MKRLGRALPLILFLSFFPSCVIEEGVFYAGLKDSCGFAVNERTGAGLRWDRSKFPVSFYIHTSVPEAAHENFISAIEHWNVAWEEFLDEKDIEPFVLFEAVDEWIQYSGAPRQDSYNMLFFMGPDFSKYGGENSSVIQAFTALNSNKFTSKIKDTDILVNDKDYKFFYDESYIEDVILAKKNRARRRSLASTRSLSFWMRLQERIKEWFKIILKPFRRESSSRHIARKIKIPRGYIDFPSLIIHELGHVPGLDHVKKEDFRKDSKARNLRSTKSRAEAADKIDSVMEPTLSAGAVRRSIGRYDLENLFCGYVERGESE